MPETEEEDLFGVDSAAGAQPKRFAPEEMVPCDACLRANAPTRSQCIYCGADLRLPGTFQSENAPVTVKASLDDKYMVLRMRAGRSIPDPLIDQLATKFHLPAAELPAALATGALLPLPPTSMDSEADQIVSRLDQHGFKIFPVPHADLETDVRSLRIRALEFTDGTVCAQVKSPGQRLCAAWKDLTLIVVGRLYSHRVEVDERAARDAIKHLDRRELTHDESVIDVYLRSSPDVWRITVNDFDFSCLGAQKGLIAVDNFKALIQVLSGHSGAELNDTYGRIRSMLSSIWPLETTTSRSRSRRAQARPRDCFVVTASDNEAQFNRYSRLVWKVKLRELEYETADN